MRQRDPNGYWIRWRDVGIRSFPRAGSSTITETYGRSHNLGYFLIAPKKVCVVRDPWHRLMSVWHGMVNTGRFKSYTLGHSSKNVDEFVNWVCDQDPYDCDNHITSYWAFMDGYWLPADDELMTFDKFMLSPPHGLDPITVHINKTDYGQSAGRGGVEPNTYDRWHDLLGARDYDLFNRAEKSPL